MKLAIIGAMSEEVAVLITYLENVKTKTLNGFTFYQGSFANKELIVVKSGVGKVMSAILITTLVNNFKFDYVINFGTAGGYRGLNLADVIVAKACVYGDVDVSADPKYRYGQMPKFPFTYSADEKLLNIAKDLDVRLATIMTADRFVTNFNEIKELLDKHYYDLNVLAFDMESAAFAQACHYFKLPFIAIRVISDIIGSHKQTETFISQLENVINKGNDILISLLKKL